MGADGAVLNAQQRGVQNRAFSIEAGADRRPPAPSPAAEAAKTPLTTPTPAAARGAPSFDAPYRSPETESSSRTKP